MSSLLVAIIGYVATACVSLAMWPQVIAVWRTRDVKELSFPAFALNLIGCILGATYGYIIHAMPVFVANGSIGVASAILLILIIKDSKNGDDVESSLSRYNRTIK
jgi:MtN3 and saliva related transmembrane protein